MSVRIVILLIILHFSIGMYQNEFVEKNKINYDNNTLCDVCMFVANITQDIMIVENVTLNVVENVVGTLCYIIGGPITYTECNIVMSGFQNIFNYIVNGFSPNATCENLKFCT